MVTAVINIVGKQNITFNFRRNYFGCNFCISLRMCVSILPCRCNPHCHFDVIISNVEYNSHFSVMVYPLSADDHNQHLRGNGFKIKKLFPIPQVSWVSSLMRIMYPAPRELVSTFLTSAWLGCSANMANMWGGYNVYSI